MPIYEFECKVHGPFELLRSISNSSEGAACPECAQRSMRILSTPHLTLMSRSERVARERNERSSHEPRLASTAGGQHRCSAQHAHTSSAEPRSTLTRYTGARPWVIEHG